MKLRLFGVFLVCLLLSACSSKPAAESGKGNDPRPSTDPPIATVSVKTLAEIDKVIAGHKGRVVVVDLWAMW